VPLAVLTWNNRTRSIAPRLGRQRAIFGIRVSSSPAEDLNLQAVLSAGFDFDDQSSMARGDLSLTDDFLWPARAGKAMMKKARRRKASSRS